MASARAPIPLILLTACLGVGLAWQIVPFQLDDAYITYRFAARFAAGAGLTYNPGGPWVEGFSSPVWLLALSAIATLFGPEALPRAGTGLGLASYGLVLLLVWRIGARPRTPDSNPAGGVRGAWAGPIAFALVATSPALTYYAVTGLEMLLQVAVVVAFAGAVAARIPLGWGVAAGAASLWVRPEGGWLPVMLAAQLLAERRPGDLWRRPALRLVAAVVASGVTLLAVRLAVFGEVLPNPFYAKISDVGFGLRYAAGILATPWGAAVALLGLAGALLGDRRHAGFFAAGSSWVVAAALEGGDWMPKGRMLLPALALFGLAAGGLGDPRDGVRAFLRGARARAGGAASVAAALGAAVVIAVGAVRAESSEARGAVRTLYHDVAMLRAWLVAGGARAIAMIDIGAIGFHSDLEIVDVVGLTDPVVSRSPGGHMTKEFDLSYLFETRRPDAIVIRVTRPPVRRQDLPPLTYPQSAQSRIERRIMRDPRLASDYRLHWMILPGYTREPYYGMLVYTKQGFEPPAKIDGRLRPRPRHGVRTIYTQPLKDPLEWP